MSTGAAAAAAVAQAKRYAALAADNAKALAAVDKRAVAVADTAAKARSTLADSSLDAYPDAKAKLQSCLEAADRQTAVLEEEKAVRQDLATAISAKDDAAIKAAQARLTALKAKSPAIYGKGGAYKPIQQCPNSLNTASCDSMIVKQKYPGYGGPGSPVSPDSPCFGTSLNEWQGLDAMEKAGCMTGEERSIIEAMAANEGAFESVQSYDSASLTAGAMQKTMVSDGKGELPAQLSDFQTKHPDKFKSLFADQGWSLDKGKLTYTDATGVARTGSAFSTWVRGADAKTAAKALSPFRKAGRDEDFRKQQICDFVDRLHAASDKPVTIGGNEVAAGDILTSTQGKAMLLDTSVNAGPNSKAFQRSVDAFYKANSKAAKDPAAWTAVERAKYESDILSRFTSTRPVTDRLTRNKHLAGLSATENVAGKASDRPATTCPDC